MRPYDPEKPLFSLHVPKAAGSSVLGVLGGWFGEKLLLHYYDERKGRMPEHHDAGPGTCVHGHFNRRRGFGVLDYYPRAEQFITVLRDPLELQLSNYFYVKKKHRESASYRGGATKAFPWKDVDDYLERTCSLLLAHFPWDLGAGDFRELLQGHFVFLGTVERLAPSLAALAAKLGKEAATSEILNFSPRDEEPSARAVSRWKAKRDLEYRVYDYVRMCCP